MHLNPTIPKIVLLLFVLVGISIILKKFKQPGPVAYIISGAILGPNGFGWIKDQELIQDFGSIGVVFLLFFIGLELSLRDIVKDWKTPVVGIFVQILLSVGVVLGLGQFLNWPLNRSILIGFVISLSSTAMVLRLLEERGELQSSVGRYVLSILIIQDLAIIPMLIGIGLLAGQTTSWAELSIQLAGAVTLILLPIVAFKTNKKYFTFFSKFKNDKEIQVLGSLMVCLGLAYVSGLLGLSTALGAFVGGLVISALKGGNWFKESLHPFYVVFMAIFFTSVGFFIDFKFLASNWKVVLIVTALTLLVNTFINSFTLKYFKRSWRESLYGSSLLAPIGEFSFVLAAVGTQVGIIENYAHQVTILTISFTMMLTPIWASLFRYKKVWK